MSQFWQARLGSICGLGFICGLVWMGLGFGWQRRGLADLYLWLEWVTSKAFWKTEKGNGIGFVGDDGEVVWLWGVFWMIEKVWLETIVENGFHLSNEVEFASLSCHLAGNWTLNLWLAVVWGVGLAMGLRKEIKIGGATEKGNEIGFCWRLLGHM